MSSLEDSIEKLKGTEDGNALELLQMMGRAFIGEVTPNEFLQRTIDLGGREASPDGALPDWRALEKETDGIIKNQVEHLEREGYTVEVVREPLSRGGSKVSITLSEKSKEACPCCDDYLTASQTLPVISYVPDMVPEAFSHLISKLGQMIKEGPARHHNN